MEDNNRHIYTEEELMARLKFFIGICLSLTLFGIVFVVLYSLIFVTQPLNAISPIDQKFFELIVPIATFLTGTLSGIMLAGGDKDLREKALEAANKAPVVSPAPVQMNSNPAPSFNNFNHGSFGGMGMGTQLNMGQSNNFGGGSPFGQPMQPSQPMTSSRGKPMPFQEPEPEL